jgi:hypothetical protein
MVVINTGNLYNVHSHAAVYSDMYLVQSSGTKDATSAQTPQIEYNELQPNCRDKVRQQNGGSAVLFAMKGEQYSQKQQITGY